MSYVPVPRQPTADRKEFLQAMQRILTKYAEEKARNPDQEYLLSDCSKEELNDLYQRFMKEYGPDGTVYVRRSLRLSYAEDRKAGVCAEEFDVFIEDLYQAVHE